MTSAIVGAFTDVFDAIGTWIKSAVTAMIPMFWTEGANGSGSLTFLGVLAICALGFSVVFLVIGIIQRFLHFGG